jgi:hypothetical protein
MTDDAYTGFSVSGAGDEFGAHLADIRPGTTWSAGIKLVSGDSVVMGRHIVITVPGQLLNQEDKDRMIAAFRECWNSTEQRVTETKRYVHGFDMKPCSVFYIEW